MTKWILAALAVTVATPALAQDGYYQGPRDPYIDYAPVPEDANVFSGIRVEARIGYDTLDLGGVVGDDDVTYKKHGLSYGGEIGYDFALGRSVTLGLYGGIDGATTEACEDILDGRACLKPRRLINAGGRLGVSLGGRALVYAKGGYSNGGLRLDYRDPTTPGNNFDFRQNLEGFHVGAGIEASLFRNGYGKIEYVYTRLNRTERGDDDFGNLDRQQVNAGLGVRF